jgi:hypothetical protein
MASFRELRTNRAERTAAQAGASQLSRQIKAVLTELHQIEEAAVDAMRSDAQGIRRRRLETLGRFDEGRRQAAREIEQRFKQRVGEAKSVFDNAWEGEGTHLKIAVDGALIALERHADHNPHLRDATEAAADRVRQAATQAWETIGAAKQNFGGRLGYYMSASGLAADRVMVPLGARPLDYEDDGFRKDVKQIGEGAQSRIRSIARAAREHINARWKALEEQAYEGELDLTQVEPEVRPLLDDVQLQIGDIQDEAHEAQARRLIQAVAADYQEVEVERPLREADAFSQINIILGILEREFVSQVNAANRTLRIELAEAMGMDPDDVAPQLPDLTTPHSGNAPSVESRSTAELGGLFAELEREMRLPGQLGAYWDTGIPGLDPLDGLQQ